MIYYDEIFNAEMAQLFSIKEFNYFLNCFNIEYSNALYSANLDTAIPYIIENLNDSNKDMIIVPLPNEEYNILYLIYDSTNNFNDKLKLYHKFKAFL